MPALEPSKNNTQQLFISRQTCKYFYSQNPKALLSYTFFVSQDEIKKGYKIVEMRKYIKRWNCSQLNTLTGGIHLNNNESEAFKSFMFAVLSFSPFAFHGNSSLCCFLRFSVSCYRVHSLFSSLFSQHNNNIVYTYRARCEPEYNFRIYFVKIIAPVQERRGDETIDYSYFFSISSFRK